MDASGFGYDLGSGRDGHEIWQRLPFWFLFSTNRKGFFYQSIPF